MEVYVEMTYVLNAFLIFMSFELLCFLLNQRMLIKELLKYVFVYNISVVFLFIDFFEWFYFLYTFVLTVCFFRQLTYIYYPIFIFIYISLLSFFSMIIPDSTIFQCILIVEGLNLSSAVVIAMIVVCLCYFYIVFCKRKIDDHELVSVLIFGKECLGFIDNGNKVFYKGYPVSFLNKDVIGNYQKIDCIEVETATSTDLIDIVFVDEMKINQQSFYHIYIGIMNSSQYDCILNAQLLGGML